MMKRIKTIAGILIIALIISNIATYALAKKDLIGFFFNGKKNEKIVKNNLLVKNNQKIVIDDYTVTLEESLCEKKTQMGYLVFSIKTANGKPEADIINDSILKAFGKDNRFIFDYEATGSMNKVAEYVGDVLYVYVSFEANIMDFDDLNMSDCVKITDLSKDDNDGYYKQYTFDLQYSDASKSFKTNDGMIYISPLGCKYVTSKSVDDLDISIKLSGDEIALNKQSFGNAGINNRIEGTTEIHYTHMFEKLLDIEDIKEVIFNNQKLIETK